VLPGTYTVSLEKSVDGKLTTLSGPVQFELKTLGGVTLPAEDRRDLVEFQSDAQELQ